MALIYFPGIGKERIVDHSVVFISQILQFYSTADKYMLYSLKKTMNNQKRLFSEKRKRWLWISKHFGSSSWHAARCNGNTTLRQFARWERTAVFFFFSFLCLYPLILAARCCTPLTHRWCMCPQMNKLTSKLASCSVSFFQLADTWLYKSQLQPVFCCFNQSRPVWSQIGP